jgi:hypothetical protein
MGGKFADLANREKPGITAKLQHELDVLAIRTLHLNQNASSK